MELSQNNKPKRCKVPRRAKKQAVPPPTSGSWNQVDNIYSGFIRAIPEGNVTRASFSFRGAGAIEAEGKKRVTSSISFSSCCGWSVMSRPGAHGVYKAATFMVGEIKDCPSVETIRFKHSSDENNYKWRKVENESLCFLEDFTNPVTVEQLPDRKKIINLLLGLDYTIKPKLNSHWGESVSISRTNVGINEAYGLSGNRQQRETYFKFITFMSKMIFSSSDLYGKNLYTVFADRTRRNSYLWALENGFGVITGTNNVYTDKHRIYLAFVRTEDILEALNLILNDQT